MKLVYNYLPSNPFICLFYFCDFYFLFALYNYIKILHVIIKVHFSRGSSVDVPLASNVLVITFIILKTKCSC